MKNKWFIKWLGYVKVRIEGRGANGLLMNVYGGIY